MAKAFSIASWNVEHFRGDPIRTDRDHQFRTVIWIMSMLLST